MNKTFYTVVKNIKTDEVIKLIPAPSKYARKKVVSKMLYRIDDRTEYITTYEE